MVLKSQAGILIFSYQITGFQLNNIFAEHQSQIKKIIICIVS